MYHTGRHKARSWRGAAQELNVLTGAPTDDSEGQKQELKVLKVLKVLQVLHRLGGTYLVQWLWINNQIYPVCVASLYCITVFLWHICMLVYNSK